MPIHQLLRPRPKLQSDSIEHINDFSRYKIEQSKKDNELCTVHCVFLNRCVLWDVYITITTTTIINCGKVNKFRALDAVNFGSSNDVNLAVEIAAHYISIRKFMAAFIQIKIWVGFTLRNMDDSGNERVIPFCLSSLWSVRAPRGQFAWLVVVFHKTI